MISIGIDAAKGKSTVCILKPYGEVVVPPRDVSHTAAELKSLMFLGRTGKGGYGIDRHLPLSHSARTC